MATQPRALGSSGSGGDTPTPVPTTAKALWSAKVVLTAVDVANKYFDLPIDAPNIVAGYGPNVIVTVETTVQYTPRSYLATTDEAGKLRRITWNGLDLEDDPPLQTGYNLWVIYPMQIMIEGSAGTYHHDELDHRDYVDQHPVEAITGLKDALQRLSDGQTANSHDKGWFEDEAALNTAYPTANAGDFATVGETDTVWLWSMASSTWVNSNVGGNVTSITTPVGERETGDINITINKLGITGDPAAINDAVLKRHSHDNKSLLDSLLSSGDGTRVLADNGEYIPAPGGGDMLKSVYDKNNNGIVDECETINGYTRDAFIKIITNASFLVTDGDGTKFLNDQGQYVSQTAFWNRWRGNQPPLPLNEIAVNGKRYYGVCGATSAYGGTTTWIWFPLAISGAVDRDTMHIAEASGLLSSTGEVYIPGYFDDINSFFGFKLDVVGKRLGVRTTGIFSGQELRVFAYIKFTYATDSPIV